VKWAGQQLPAIVKLAQQQQQHFSEMGYQQIPAIVKLA